MPEPQEAPIEIKSESEKDPIVLDGDLVNSLSQYGDPKELAAKAVKFYLDIRQEVKQLQVSHPGSTVKIRTILESTPGRASSHGLDSAIVY